MKVEINFNDLELESDCYACGGYGWNPSKEDRTTQIPCGVCEGRGVLLTNNGKEMLEFLLRWLKGINR